MRHSSFGEMNEEDSRNALIKHIGKCIRLKRKEMKWTQERFAQEVGISDKYVYDIEYGKKSIRVCLLQKIALALKVAVCDLLPQDKEIL